MYYKTGVFVFMRGNHLSTKLHGQEVLVLLKGVGPSTTLAWPGWKQPEPVLLNVYGAPELIPRNEFRQPM